jgi:pimeloyl-ACP methyl ester carboxylesterase
VSFRFTSLHRGGSGPPLVCLHGFTDTWRTWELVLPRLEAHHDVLAPTLPGHAGGGPLGRAVTDALLPDAVERAMDEAGFPTAHLVGNSLGGFVALQLAARGRARSVVAFAPAGGWAPGDESFRDVLALNASVYERARATAAHAEAIAASPEGRRAATRLVTTRFEHIPADLVAHLIVGVANATGALQMIEYALREGYRLDVEPISCPLRIVWGTEDAILPWPSAAAGYRRSLAHADWVELDGVGHCPQLDVPSVAAELILGFTGSRSSGAAQSVSPGSGSSASG